jgi:N-acetylneuraminate synthase
MRSSLIADIGLNHNGDIAIAKKLMDYCKFFGIDFCKFQKRTPDVCVPDDQKDVMRETPWGRMTYLDYRKKIEFGIAQYVEIAVYAKQIGIEWFASVWDTDSLDLMVTFSPPFIKIPSACLTNYPLLEKAKNCGIPVILSTGMSDFPMIDKAVDILGDSLYYLLHCTSTYPCKTDEQNISVISNMKQLYPTVKIGFSNHHTGIPGIVAAMALDAEMIEVHVTLDRAMWGTDQAASIEPEGIWKICKYRDYMANAMGDGEKRIYDSERAVMAKLRKIV